MEFISLGTILCFFKKKIFIYCENLLWIYSSNHFAVLFLEYTLLNLARNQRPIQIRISTPHIFQSKSEAALFITQRKLLSFSFQVLCSKLTVYIDYTKGSCVVWAVSGGGNHYWGLASVKTMNWQLLLHYTPFTGPTPALFNFTVICRYSSGRLSWWWWAMFQYTCTYLSNTFYQRTFT